MVNGMDLKCPQCGTVVYVVNPNNFNEVYEKYDQNKPGYCPNCDYKFLQ